MQFTPKTEKEIIEANLWPEGEYSFQIARAIDSVSKNGNEMIKLTLNVYNNEGRSQIIYDYLMEVMEFKLRHCAEACGLIKKYETGKLDAIDFEGKTGTVKIAIQKDKSGQYPDKNAVKDYVVESKLTTAQEKHTKDKGNAYVSDDLDDEIPF